MPASPPLPPRRGERVGESFTVVVHADNAAFERADAERIAARHQIGITVTGAD
jgi:L-aminopeptidase/D-esterase-like protein